jgi:hypothetical protein
MARYRGFWGRVRANLLIEQALKFGADCYGINLRPTLAPVARPLMRQHLEQEGVPNTKEEVFFAFAAAVAGIVGLSKRAVLRNDVMLYNDLRLVSDDVMLHFLCEASKYSGDDDEEDGRQWVMEGVAQSESFDR